MKTEIKETCGGFELVNSDWNCGLTDGDEVKDVSLGVFAEVIDIRDYDDEEQDSEFPFVLNFKVIPLLKSLSEGSIDKLVKNVSLEPSLSDISRELGSIAVDINSCGHVNEDLTSIDYDPDNESVCFATAEDAEMFVRKIAAGRLESMMSMIGLYFDMPVNRIGTTGFEILESIIFGEDFMEKTLVRKSEMIEEQ